MSFKFITQPENIGQVPFRFLSTLITRALNHTSITPNQVTVFRSIIVIFSLYYFTRGDSLSLVIAVVLFYIFEVLDHVDGDLARLTGKTSEMGPLLEQFVDTWASRPSNIFGLCVAWGMYNETNSVLGLVLFAVTNLGRLLWLEYRNVFGWVQGSTLTGERTYRHILHTSSLVNSVKVFFEVLYIWNNTFILIGALLFALGIGEVNPLEIGFAIVAIINNLPWVIITLQGFNSALSQDRRDV